MRGRAIGAVLCTDAHTPYLGGPSSSLQYSPEGLSWDSGCSPPIGLLHLSSPSQSPTAVILCPAKEEGTAATAGVRNRTELWCTERYGEGDVETR